ncbi:putative phosphatidylethanolamine-binding protein [Operophtera brumata]|uniref:Putative phosphatidylethanolamine-binding protein n=1 Tax=Operophtera brumata TaxID=104452 RepID=A0A0L7L8T4_OPEBR|nr:putative phosphatidylethanolamine-binding protein [Operophtera brumata]
MLGILLLVSACHSVIGVNTQCSVTEVKSLLEGCDRLTGLNMTSAGGTIVNDHNCDVMLPKQVFTEEPLFQYYLADSCSVTEVKSLLEGCDRLTGLNMTSAGGTIVNDHNCDVMLPKQVFTEEPLFQYYLADSKKFYTIIMVDPDAAPQVDGEFFLHMLKSNVPVSSADVFIPTYIPTTADGNNFLPSVPSSRYRFALAKWLLGKNLCGPVAGTQFRAEF